MWVRFIQVAAMTQQPLLAMQLVRLAEFTTEDEWRRPLDHWTPAAAAVPEDAAPMQIRQLRGEAAYTNFESLLKHLLVRASRTLTLTTTRTMQGQRITLTLTHRSRHPNLRLG